MGRRCKSRHRKCWVFRDNRWAGERCLLWCYECGAIRLMPDDKGWTYPVGPEGENPAVTALQKREALG